MLRWSLLVVGALLVFVGVIWYLQGSGILLGSPMTGQTRWRTNGGFAALGGAIIIAANWRRRR